ncbi:uncharacterized protein Gasu_52600 [Galdieria sulphuraria]|uniref:Uncharacterized protein n=1 Tax=Galdieria sulphuraria TaxID=130081 RepID=M2XU15_GALSU|nr:uncharacterized protein Gasu_52600 [Galdieria sulphuraria]EME27158.1 hypothetical protein Gasu_52600 [Galdieria sulphuraria]|eukprot:XP_005703678.1 hypothetical protein Gasu_52600 [Galdieria sulphuraria]
MQAVEYRNYIIKSTKDLLPGFLQAMKKDKTPLNHMHINMAALLSLVALWTQDSSLYQQSYLIFKSFLQQFGMETLNLEIYREPHKVRNHSCPFTGYPFIICFRNLQSVENLWSQMTKEWDPKVLRKIISDVAFIFCRPMQRGDHNQAMARALGTALALSALDFMKKEQEPIWSHYVEEIWEEWRTYEDTCENAPSYNAIYLWCLLMMLDLYPQKLKYFTQSKRAYALFQRYRDHISQSFCTIPKYGDDGGPGDLFFRSADAWPAIFEKVASIFDDETFQWAALQMFRGEKDGKHHATRQPQMLFMLAMASNWKPKISKALPPSTGSAILYRGRDIPSMPQDIPTADKIVLTQNRFSQAPFAMFEIFSRGHHSHFHPGSLIWYDNGQYAMFASLGYHNSYQHQANSLFIDTYEPQRYWQDAASIYSSWQLCQIPSVLLKPVINGDSKLRIIEAITYRFENPTNSPMHLQIANVGLEGGSEFFILEHFDDPQYHMRNAQVIQMRHSDNADAPSQNFLDILVFPGVSFNSTDKNSSLAPQNIVVDTQRFPYFKFWWRIESHEISNCLKPSNFIIRTSDALYDITPLNPKFVLHFDKRAAMVLQNADGDQFTRFRFAHYGEDLNYGRFVILLKEGILLAIDSITKPPGKELKKIASISWHVLATDVVQDLAVLQGETSEDYHKSMWAEFRGFPHVNNLNTRTIDPNSSLLFVTPRQEDQSVALVEPSFWGVRPKSIVLGRQLEANDNCLNFVSLFYPKNLSLDSKKIVSQIVWKEVALSTIRVELQTSVQSLCICVVLNFSTAPEWTVSRT